MGVGTLVVALLCGGAWLRASGQALDVSAYLADLDRLIAAVPAAATSDLTSLRETIPAAWVVRTESGEISIPAGWLRRSIEEGRRDPSSWAARRADILARLSAARAEAASLQTPPLRADAGVARSALEGVLAEKEFLRSANATTLAHFRRKIANWILRLWQRLGGERLGRRRTAILFAWAAGLAALVTLSWWIVRGILGARDPGRLALTVPRAVRRSARAWALQAASAQDAREATRFAYCAAVVRLEEEGTWRPDPARTPREHVRLLPPGHARRRLFADVARRFEEIWFGGRVPTGDDTREVLARLKELGCLPAD